MRLCRGTNIRNTEHYIPFARGKRSGQIRGSGIGSRNREARFVTATPAAKALRIEQPDVDDGFFLVTGICELNRYASRPRRHLEGQPAVRLIVATVDVAFENIRGRQILRPQRRWDEQPTGKNQNRDPHQWRRSHERPPQDWLLRIPEMNSGAYAGRLADRRSPDANQRHDLRFPKPVRVSRTFNLPIVLRSDIPCPLRGEDLSRWCALFG